MMGVIELGVALVITIIAMAVFGWRAVKANQKAKEYKEQLKVRKEDVVSLSRTNRDLEQHNQDLNNALNTNSKVLDERAAAVLDMKFKMMDLERDLNTEKKKFKDLIRQKKSSEVRVGLIGEQIAPFLDAWPFDTKNFKFMGAPIDGISFEPDGVVLIEIKTGKAKLSTKQRQIKKQVKEGKVKFMEFRIEEDGYRCKTE